MSRSPASHVVRRRWTRRDLLKVAPVAGVAAGAAGLVAAGRGEPPVTHARGTCRFCLMHCGVVSTLHGSRLAKVEGDLRSRTRGYVCEHGYALRELVHAHQRLSLPLVRVGDELHEVSWDDALGEVARRLEEVKRRHGPQALVIQTGWPLVRHPLTNFLHRFARAFGTPNVATVASLCEASLRMGQALTVGTKYAPDIRRVKTLVVWGANPPVTAPPFFHLVAQKAESGALVVVDPVRTTLAREATMHLRVRPGTDGALALGLIHQLVSAKRYDAGFVAEHTRGFEALASLASAYPPDRVEALTSVKAGDVVKAAELLAGGKPTAIWQGLGVEHHHNGVQTVRAISSLEVLLDRFDGSHAERAQVSQVTEAFLDQPLPALYRMTTPEPVPPPVGVPTLGGDVFPLFEMYNREAHGEALADAVLEDRPYPVRAVVLWASNALITASGSERLARAADRLELLVAVDPFLSASARRADVVLPAGTFAEAPDVDADDAQVAQGSLVPPQGEARPDFTILTGLARAMGLGKYFPWNSFHEAMAAPHVPWMEDVRLQPRPDPGTPARPRFGTITGKAELASAVLERHGHDPLPVWTPPPRQPSGDYPLRLVTGPRPRARINSQFGESPSIRARLPAPEALVHPDAARAAGVVHGASVDIVSPAGRIAMRLVVTDDVHPECVVIPAGWEEASANVLVDGEVKDPISGFPAFRSDVCRVERRTS